MDSQDEFVRLLSKHAKQIYGFILLMVVDRADAEDLFQETSVVLWRKFQDFELGTNFKAWASRIAYYEVISHLRNQERRRVLSENAMHVLANDAFAEDENTDARIEPLDECLNRLPEADRKLLDQKYYQQLSTNDIAQKTCKSVHSVYRSLQRIHRSLIRCVARVMAS